MEPDRTDGARVDERAATKARPWKNVGRRAGLPPGPGVCAPSRIAATQGSAYVSVSRDVHETPFKPYLYMTNDYLGARMDAGGPDGANGLPSNHRMALVREIRARKGCFSRPRCTGR